MTSLKTELNSDEYLNDIATIDGGEARWEAVLRKPNFHLTRPCRTIKFIEFL